MSVWIREKKLGALALLRNLRNMGEAGCDPALVKEAILTADYERVLLTMIMKTRRTIGQTTSSS